MQPTSNATLSFTVCGNTFFSQVSHSQSLRPTFDTLQISPQTVGSCSSGRVKDVVAQHDIDAPILHVDLRQDNLLECHVCYIGIPLLSLDEVRVRWIKHPLRAHCCQMEA